MFYGIGNVLLLLGMLGCAAAAMAGLVVFLPFVAGAWALNLAGLLGYEEGARNATAPDSGPNEAVSAAETAVGRDDAGRRRALLPQDSRP